MVEKRIRDRKLCKFLEISGFFFPFLYNVSFKSVATRFLRWLQEASMLMVETTCSSLGGVVNAMPFHFTMDFVNGP